MVVIYNALVDVDTLVVGVVGTMDTVEDVLLWVDVGSYQVGYLGFEQDSSCSSCFAVAGGRALTAEHLIKSSDTLVLATGKYQLAYREFISLP